MANMRRRASIEETLEMAADALSGAKGLLEGALRHGKTIESVLDMFESGQLGISLESLVDILSEFLRSAFPDPRKIRHVEVRRIRYTRTYTLVLVEMSGKEDEVFSTPDQEKAWFGAKILMAWKEHGGG